MKIAIINSSARANGNTERLLKVLDSQLLKSAAALASFTVIVRLKMMFQNWKRWF